MKKFFLMTVLASFALCSVATNYVMRADAKKQTAQPTMLKPMALTKGMPLKTVLNMPPLTATGDAIDTLYQVPVGGNYCMPFLTEDGYFSYYTSVGVPSEVDITWRNSVAGTGVNENTTYEWYYFDRNTNDEMAVSTDYDLVTNYKGDLSGLYYAPALFVNGDENIYYRLGDVGVQHGGGIAIESEEMGVTLTRINFEPFDAADNYGLAETYITGKTTAEYDINSRWTTDLLPDMELTDVDSLSSKAICQMLPDPGREFTISHMQCFAEVTCAAGATAIGKVIGKDADGYFDFDNPLAEATYVFPSAVSGEFALMDFQFEHVDADGLVSVEPVVMSGDVLLLVDGIYENNDFVEFWPLVQQYSYPFLRTQGHDNFDENGYMLLNTYNGGELTGFTSYPINGGYFWGSGSDVSTYNLPANVLIGADVTYPFIYNTESEEEITLKFNTAGESKTIILGADRMFDEWTLSADAAGEVEVPSWLTFEAVDSIDAQYSEFIGKVAVTINAEALTGTTGRTTEVYFKVPTMTYKITCVQGDSTPQLPYGDVTGDGYVDVDDVNAVINITLGLAQATDYPGQADLDGDGAIDVADMNAVLNAVLGL